MEPRNVLVSPSVSFSTTKTEVEYNVHASPIHESMLASEPVKEEMSFYAQEFGPSVIERSHSRLESGLGLLHQSSESESVHEPQLYMETSDTLGCDAVSIDDSQRTNLGICFAGEYERKAVAAGLSSRKNGTQGDGNFEYDKLSEVECGVSAICLSIENYRNEGILYEFKPGHSRVPFPGIRSENSDLQYRALDVERFPSDMLEGYAIPSEHDKHLETSVQRSMKSVETLQSCVSDMVLGSSYPSDLFRQEASKLSYALQGTESVSMVNASCFADEGITHTGNQTMECGEASLRRSSRANKFTKAPNKIHIGKGSKKTLGGTMELLPAAVRSRRSCLNRSARASIWGLLDALSKRIKLNATVDQGSRLVKNGKKSRKTDKVKVAGVSHGTYANGASSGHILKLKLVNRTKSIIEPNPLADTDTQLVHLSGNGDKQQLLSSINNDVTQDLSQKYPECSSDMKLDRSETSQYNPTNNVLPEGKDLGATLMSDKCNDINGEKSGVSADDRHLNSGTSPDSEVIQAPGSQFPCEVLEGHHCGELYPSKPARTPKKNAVRNVSKPRKKKGSKKEYCDNAPESDTAITVDAGHEPTDSRNPKKLLPPAKAQQNRKSKSKSKPSSTQRMDLSKPGGVKGDKWKLAGKQGTDDRDNTTSTNILTSGDVSGLPVVPGPRRAWVCCDDCLKWRSIPSNLVDVIDETDYTWTCKDNQDKAFANCSVPQEKSNAEINEELNLSDAEEGHDAHLSGPQQSSWMLIKSNIFLHRKRKTQSLDEVMVCLCKSSRDGKLSCGDECLNRMLNIECVQGTCPCGDLCANQQFQRQSYANLKWFRSGKKGYGLQVMEDITQGQFLIEYVGEVLELPAYEARLRVYASEGHKHFYFMTLDGNEVIDACGKGNLGRFINHSCDPNCRTEKWMVNGEICIGIFAVRNIKKGEELTFDYNYVRVFGAAAKKCHCGAAQCRGYIGGDRLNNETIVQGDSDEEFPEPVAVYENGEIADEFNVISKSNSMDVAEEKNEDTLPQNDIGTTSDDKDMVNKLECSENDGPQDSIVGCSQGTDSLETVGYMQEENTDKVQQEKPMGRSCSVSPKRSDNLSVNRFLSESVDTKIDRSSAEVAGGEAVLSKARPKMKVSRPSKHEKSKELIDSSTPVDKPPVASNKSQSTPNKMKKVVESSAKHRLETVEGKLNELLDKVGGICKRKDAFKGYLRLLVLTAASGDSNHQETIQSNKDLSMILDAILKTKSRTVLTDILNKNGLQMLHSLMKKCRGNFNKIPILRKLLKIFEVLAERNILTSEHINAEPPRPGMESFRDSVLTLTEYEDRKVHQIARSFRDRWIRRSVKKPKCMKKGDQVERPSISSNHATDSDGLEGSPPRFTARTTRKRKSGWDQLPSDLVSLAQKDSDIHESDDDAPPGFSCPSVKIPRLPNTISQQYPGPLKCPTEIPAAFPQEIYNSALPISYGVPFNIVQEFGTPQSSTSDRWVIAPGMPFQPFPPLPSYPHQRWNRETSVSSGTSVERARKSQERMDHGVPVVSNLNTDFKQGHINFRNPSWGGSRHPQNVNFGVKFGGNSF